MTISTCAHEAHDVVIREELARRGCFAVARSGDTYSCTRKSAHSEFQEAIFRLQDYGPDTEQRYRFDVALPNALEPTEVWAQAGATVHEALQRIHWRMLDSPNLQPA